MDNHRQTFKQTDGQEQTDGKTWKTLTDGHLDGQVDGQLMDSHKETDGQTDGKSQAHGQTDEQLQVSRYIIQTD